MVHESVSSQGTCLLVQAFSVYKGYLKKMATRVNTFTGIMYKDDPTIFAWDLLNEPRYPADQQPNRALTCHACILPSLEFVLALASI